MSNFFEAGKAAMTSNKDDWETPQILFDELNEEFCFTLDPASTDKNAKCETHYTVEQDGLNQDWGGHSVFCNPPYGRDMHKWVQKCYQEAQKPYTTVVMLIPARTDTRYFHDFIYHKAREIRFIKGRLKFEQDGIAGQSAPFPSMIVVF